MTVAVRGPSAVALAAAGSAAVATAFGMARYGYGLLLPDIQEDLVLGVGTLGAVGSLAYATYLLATLLVSRCVARAGERLTAVAGGLLAVVGAVIVAAADGPVLLGLGVAVAGASAGLVFAPFGEAVRRLPRSCAPARWRPSAVARGGVSRSPRRSPCSRPTRGGRPMSGSPSVPC